MDIMLPSWQSVWVSDIYWPLEGVILTSQSGQWLIVGTHWRHVEGLVKSFVCRWKW